MEWHLRRGFERSVHTRSRSLAPVAHGGPFAVVLLEHGSGVVPALYTVLAEGLASSGDRRILAAVNLDGSTYPGMNGIVRSLAIHKPLLFVATEAHAAGDTRAREFVGSEANTYYVVVPHADHMSLTDLHIIDRLGRDSQPNARGRMRCSQQV